MAHFLSLGQKFFQQVRWPSLARRYIQLGISNRMLPALPYLSEVAKVRRVRSSIILV